jgi:hypothetical protein
MHLLHLLHLRGRILRADAAKLRGVQRSTM